jgi:hypothetical protein
MEGSLLGSAGPDLSKAAPIAAITSNIWRTFEKSGEMGAILLDNEVRSLSVTVKSILLILSP